MGASQVVLFVLNFVVFLAAVASLGFGLYIVFETAFDDNDIGEMLGGTNFQIIAMVFAGVAVVVILISFAGCCGAYKESTFLVVIYIVLLTVVVALEIAVVVMFVLYGTDIEEKTEDWLGDSMKDYSSDSDVKNAWDKFQAKFDCCAVNNYTEWAELLGSIPSSCCKPAFPNCNGSDRTELYEIGCKATVVEKIEDNMDILMYAGGALVAIQLLCLLLGCCALNSFRKDVKYA